MLARVLKLIPGAVSAPSAAAPQPHSAGTKGAAAADDGDATHDYAEPLVSAVGAPMTLAADAPLLQLGHSDDRRSISPMVATPLPSPLPLPRATAATRGATISPLTVPLSPLADADADAEAAAAAAAAARAASSLDCSGALDSSLSLELDLVAVDRSASPVDDSLDGMAALLQGSPLIPQEGARPPTPASVFAVDVPVGQAPAAALPLASLCRGSAMEISEAVRTQFEALKSSAPGVTATPAARQAYIDPSLFAPAAPAPAPAAAQARQAYIDPDLLASLFGSAPTATAGESHVSVAMEDSASAAVATVTNAPVSLNPERVAETEEEAADVSPETEDAPMPDECAAAAAAAPAGTATSEQDTADSTDLAPLTLALAAPGALDAAPLGSGLDAPLFAMEDAPTTAALVAELEATLPPLTGAPGGLAMATAMTAAEAELLEGDAFASQDGMGFAALCFAPAEGLAPLAEGSLPAMEQRAPLPELPSPSPRKQNSRGLRMQWRDARVAPVPAIDSDPTFHAAVRSLTDDFNYNCIPRFVRSSSTAETAPGAEHASASSGAPGPGQDAGGACAAVDAALGEDAPAPSLRRSRRISSSFPQWTPAAAAAAGSEPDAATCTAPNARKSRRRSSARMVIPTPAELEALEAAAASEAADAAADAEAAVTGQADSAEPETLPLSLCPSAIPQPVLRSILKPLVHPIVLLPSPPKPVLRRSHRARTEPLVVDVAPPTGAVAPLTALAPGAAARASSPLLASNLPVAIALVTADKGGKNAKKQRTSLHGGSRRALEDLSNHAHNMQLV